jgi:hypothetical protein
MVSLTHNKVGRKRTYVRIFEGNLLLKDIIWKTKKESKYLTAGAHPTRGGGWCRAATPHEPKFKKHVL